MGALDSETFMALNLQSLILAHAKFLDGGNAGICDQYCRGRSKDGRVVRWLSTFPWPMEHLIRYVFQSSAIPSEFSINGLDLSSIETSESPLTFASFTHNEIEEGPLSCLNTPPLILPAEFCRRYEVAYELLLKQAIRSALRILMMIPSSEPSRVETGNEDFFENKVAENDLHASPTDTLPDDFDQLPIELVSLTDRYTHFTKHSRMPIQLICDQLHSLSYLR